jgi:hypothetical protein
VFYWSFRRVCFGSSGVGLPAVVISSMVSSSYAAPLETERGLYLGELRLFFTLSFTTHIHKWLSKSKKGSKPKLVSINSPKRGAWACISSLNEWVLQNGFTLINRGAA